VFHSHFRNIFAALELRRAILPSDYGKQVNVVHLFPLSVKSFNWLTNDVRTDEQTDRRSHGEQPC